MDSRKEKEIFLLNCVFARILFLRRYDAELFSGDSPQIKDPTLFFFSPNSILERMYFFYFHFFSRDKMSFQEGEAQAVTEPSNDNAVTKLNHDDVAENNEKKEREQREEEMIEKAVAFWNHPSLRDVSSTEKRSYLTERQGLTSAQVMKVWERIL